MKWAENGKAHCKNCYRVGLPSGFSQHFPKFYDDRGITRLYEKLLYNDILKSDEWTVFDNLGEQGFARHVESMEFQHALVSRLWQPYWTSSHCWLVHYCNFVWHGPLMISCGYALSILCSLFNSITVRAEAAHKFPSCTGNRWLQYSFGTLGNVLVWIT